MPGLQNSESETQLKGHLGGLLAQPLPPSPHPPRKEKGAGEGTRGEGCGGGGLGEMGGGFLSFLFSSLSSLLPSLLPPILVPFLPSLFSFLPLFLPSFLPSSSSFFSFPSSFLSSLPLSLPSFPSFPSPSLSPSLLSFPPSSHPRFHHSSLPPSFFPFSLPLFLPSSLPPFLLPSFLSPSLFSFPPTFLRPPSFSFSLPPSLFFPHPTLYTLPPLPSFLLFLPRLARRRTKSFPREQRERERERGMAGATLKIEGPEVIPANCGGTVVNITLHQESGLAFLCKGAAALMRSTDAAKDATAAPSTRRPHGGVQKTLGVAQILLGAICIGLGVALSMLVLNDYIDYYYKEAVYNGVPFWMGSLFILSGTFSAVGARHGGKWVHLATFLNLGSVVAGSVAFTLGLTEFPSPTHQPYFVESLCKWNAEDWRDRSWGRSAITTPPHERDSDRIRHCQEVLWSLVRVWSCTHILLLILHVAALAVALFCFGYGVRRLWISCWGRWQDYTAVADPEESKELGKEQNVV